MFSGISERPKHNFELLARKRSVPEEFMKWVSLRLEELARDSDVTLCTRPWVHGVTGAVWASRCPPASAEAAMQCARERRASRPGRVVCLWAADARIGLVRARGKGQAHLETQGSGRGVEGRPFCAHPCSIRGQREEAGAELTEQRPQGGPGLSRFLDPCEVWPRTLARKAACPRPGSWCLWLISSGETWTLEEQLV